MQEEDAKHQPGSDEETVEMPGDEDLSRLVLEMMKGLDIIDRKYHSKTYKQCFVGKDCVAWFIANGVGADLPSSRRA